MNQIYSKKGFIVFRVGDGFIVHNTSKAFEEGHTHIMNYNTAKHIIDLVSHKSIPHHLSRYLLTSLVRLSDDEEYRNKVNSLLYNKRKKQVYVNRA